MSQYSTETFFARISRAGSARENACVSSCYATFNIAQFYPDFRMRRQIVPAVTLMKIP